MGPPIRTGPFPARRSLPRTAWGRVLSLRDRRGLARLEAHLAFRWMLRGFELPLSVAAGRSGAAVVLLARPVVNASLLLQLDAVPPMLLPRQDEVHQPDREMPILDVGAWREAHAVQGIDHLRHKLHPVAVEERGMPGNQVPHMDELRQRVAILVHNFPRPPEALVEVVGVQPVLQGGNQDVQGRSHEATIIWLERPQERDVHLQDDLRRGLVHRDEATDIHIGPLLAEAVVSLQVVPGKLDELPAVVDQLIAEMLDQEGCQLEQLDLQRLRIVRQSTAVVRSLHELLDHLAVDDLGNFVLLLCKRVRQHGRDQPLKSQDPQLFVNRRLHQDAEPVPQDLLLVRGAVGPRQLRRVELLEEREVSHRRLDEDAQHIEKDLDVLRPLSAVAEEALHENAVLVLVPRVQVILVLQAGLPRDRAPNDPDAVEDDPVPWNECRIEGAKRANQKQALVVELQQARVEGVHLRVLLGLHRGLPRRTAVNAGRASQCSSRTRSGHAAITCARNGRPDCGETTLHARAAMRLQSRSLQVVEQLLAQLFMEPVAEELQKASESLQSGQREALVVGKVLQ
eukprot:scaffold870_cov268-Pinguiococcus_pyrenoidosus.AAC.9